MSSPITPHPLLHGLLKEQLLRLPNTSAKSLCMGLMHMIIIYHGGRKGWLLDWTEYFDPDNEEESVARQREEWFVSVAKQVGLNVTIVNTKGIMGETTTFITKDPLDPAQIKTQDDFANLLEFTCKGYHNDITDEPMYGVHLLEETTGIETLAQVCLTKSYPFEAIKDTVNYQARLFTHILSHYFNAKVTVKLTNASRTPLKETLDKVTPQEETWDMGYNKELHGNHGVFVATNQAQALRFMTSDTKQFVADILEAPWQYLGQFLRSSSEQRNLGDIMSVYQMIDTLRNATLETGNTVGGKRRKKSRKTSRKRKQKRKSKKRH